MTEKQQKLLQTLEEKFKQRTSNGTQSAENAYGSAYQACVAAGLRQQIKLKYRG